MGMYYWIGMNSVILLCVELGNHTIVAAGSIVTKSFKDGYCVIVGVPSKKIEDLNKENIVEYKNKYEFCGYYPAKD